MTPEERRALITEIAEILNSSTMHLSQEEQQWVRLAIQKEAQSIELRRAIIDKTISSLIWSGIVGVGYIILDFLRSHGFKG